MFGWRRRAGEEFSLNRNPLFTASNLMQRDCAITIATPEGRDLCIDFVRRADVVVDNFRLGVMKSFGLGYDDLRAIKLAIIAASVSGYGHTGAYIAFTGVAPNRHAFTGLSAATRFLGGPPEQIFVYYADIPPGQAAARADWAHLAFRR